MADLVKEITCGQCRKIFEQPKALPCGHCFCKQCLEDISLITDAGMPIKCPECDMEVTLPATGAEGLADASCVERLKKYKDLLDSHARGSSRWCEIHNSSLVLFCNECECVICHDCTLNEHKGHCYESNSEAAPKKKDYLLEAIKPLKEVKYDYKMALAKVKGVQEDLNAQGEAIAEYVTSYFTELQSVLDLCKQNLLEKNQQILMKKLANLKAQEKDLSDTYTDLQNTTESTEMHVSSCSNDEIMPVFSDLKKQISKIKEDYNIRFLSSGTKRFQKCELKPVESMFSDVKVMPAAQFSAVSETFAQFVEIPIICRDAEIQNLNQEAATATTYSFMLLSKKKHAKIEVLMSNPHSLSPMECFISRMGACSYQVTYTTPRLPCKCTIHILMDGKDIDNSPVSLSVKHYCSFMKKFFKPS